VGRSLLRRLGEPLFDLIYPPRCRLCGGSADDGLACAAHALPEGLDRSEPQGVGRCGRCAAPLPLGLPDGLRCAGCRRRPLPLRGVEALGPYRSGDSLREWILAWKHGGRRELSRPLAWSLAAVLRRRHELEARASRVVLVPVPLHFARRLERGFDQAAELAAELSRATDLPMLAALRRTRATAPQGSASSPSRAANVRGAFVVRRRASRKLAGTDVWLVDDVVTSCATAAACARVLRRAGARRVRVACLARAVAPGGRESH